MTNKIHRNSAASCRKWVQVGFSLGLALFLFLIPLTLGHRFSLDSTPLSPFFPISGAWPGLCHRWLDHHQICAGLCGPGAGDYLHLASDQ